MMTEDGKADAFEGWAILELMGHRKLAGYLRAQVVGGASFLRIDVPAPDGAAMPITATQFYAPAAVYCITPVTEALARKVAAGSQPAPVTRWELPEARYPYRDGTGRETDEDEEDVTDGEV